MEMELFVETIFALLGMIVIICLTIFFVGVYIVIKNSIQLQVLILIFIIESMIGISVHEKNAGHLSMSILGLALIGALWIFDDDQDRTFKVCLIFISTVVAVLAGVFIS